jgi:hypothetical protein
METAFVVFALERLRTLVLALSLIIMAKTLWLVAGPIVAPLIG